MLDNMSTSVYSYSHQQPATENEMEKQFEISRYGSSKFELIDNQARLGHIARSVAVLEFDSSDQANDFAAYVNRLPNRAERAR